MNNRSDIGKSILPVTLNQERRLLAEALATIKTGKAPAPFHMTAGLELTGELDIYSLEKALNCIVERHTALRATFFPARADEGFATTYKQRVIDHVPMRLQVTSLAHLSKPDQVTMIPIICTQEYEVPFDYYRPPLIRARLLRMSAKKHVLSVVVSHLVFDLWSQRILVRELAAFYESKITGKPVVMPPLRAQFSDFAVWERQQLKRGAFHESLSYWHSRLPALTQGLPQLQDFLETVRVSSTSDPGTGTEWISFEQELADAVDGVARRCGVSRHMLLLAAFFVLLHSYTGKSSVSLCGNFANRVAPEMADFIGWTTNTHLINADLSKDVRFVELVAGVRSTVLAAMLHEQFSLATALQHVTASQATDTLVFFDTWSEGPPVTFSNGSEMIQIELPINAMEESRSCLFVKVCGCKGNLRLSATYSRDKFTRSGVRQMLKDLLLIIIACSSAPDTRIRKLLI